jgi:hypothetical protein
MGHRESQRPMKSGEPAAALRGAIVDALRALRHEPLDDESVHAVRKHIKQARAALRLLRESVGEPAYRRENRRLRDASRPLARMRDVRVTAQSLAALRRHVSAGGQQALQGLSTRMATEHHRAWRQLKRARLDRIARALQAAGRVARRWQKKRVAHAALRSDLKRAYRKARSAAAAARAQRSSESLHEARKQAKYLGCMLEILRPRLDGGGKARRGALSLAEFLGDDRDLAVLQKKLDALPDLAHDGGQQLLKQVEKRRGRLQGKAMREAKRLYQRRPKRFARRLQLG